MKNICISFLLIFSFSLSLSAQRKVESSSEIYHELQKLKVVGNVLYFAAHPDDENTRLIAWLENEKKVRTAYLSLTRGDGGQNLIGTEKGDALGVLRTQELLEARNEDGGEQFFSRAKDFGYSKTADETFEKWNKQDILWDAVWVIRKFQPDVIVTRFPPDGRGGHGHHTASAIVAEEAFKLAADPEAFTDQLKYVDVWQSKRILWNTSVWWDRQLPEKAAKEDDYIKIDIGDYNPVLGLSYSEIAADARSQHRSQGFGSARSRGSQIEYLKHTAGHQAESDLFEGIDLSWSRIENGDKVEKQIEAILADYDINDPSASLNDLLELHKLISGLEESIYKDEKLQSLNCIILAVSGIYAEALGDEYLVSREALNGNFILVKRSEVDATLRSISYADQSKSLDSNLIENKEYSVNFTFDAKYFTGRSHPYWLSSHAAGWMMMSETLQYYGLPENKPRGSIEYTIDFNGYAIEFEEELDYKWTDRAKGELHRDVVMSPSATLSSVEESQLFVSNESKEIRLIAEAHKDSMEVSIEPIIPEGWKVEPSMQKISLEKKGQQKNVLFRVIPPKESSNGKLKFNIGDQSAYAIQRMEYDHIRPQVMFPETEIQLVKFNLNGKKQKLAYIEGSGDLVDENLEQIGYEVKRFTAEEFLTADLSDFQSVLVGIRAYNTEEKIASVNQLLNDFAAKGGTVVVQYNTSRGLKSDEIGPYPLKLGRGRVTDEYAEPIFIKSDHAVLNQPNKLTAEDFENWVQERGLYFASEWDEAYQSIISWNDPNEESLSGSLLVADHGDGHFIYTGISFFRQLPAGVPGAYRLLANLLAYGQE
ncbi:MAG: LmbE family protein [Flavobacteriales bacterium]|nr:LmbE family protein [Flavobacteriales bacterium]